MSKVGLGFQFTESPDSYVALPDSPAFQPTNNELTIEAWIKPDFSVLNGDDTILIKRDGCAGTFPYIFAINKGDVWWGGQVGNVAFTMLGVTPYPGFSSTNRVPDDGQFHHVAATFDGKAASNNCLIYLDGQIAGVGTSPGAIPLASSAPVIGADLGCGTYSKAAIDEVSFYNRALSPGEIAAIYAAGAAGKCLGPFTNECANLAIDLYAGISVQGTAGAPYRIEYVSNVDDTNWSELTDFILAQSPSLLFDPDSPRLSRRFYRVVCAPANGLVALGEALFDDTSDQFPTNSYRPFPPGSHRYCGYGSLAPYSMDETVSYGESVAGVAAAKVNFVFSIPGAPEQVYWYAHDVHGDMRLLRSVLGGVVTWEASATAMPPLMLPANPSLYQCWPELLAAEPRSETSMLRRKASQVYSKSACSQTTTRSNTTSISWALAGWSSKPQRTPRQAGQGGCNARCVISSGVPAGVRV